MSKPDLDKLFTDNITRVIKVLLYSIAILKAGGVEGEEKAFDSLVISAVKDLISLEVIVLSSSQS